MENFDHLIGLTVEEARSLMEEYKIRVVRNERGACVCTCDYRLDRINVITDNNIITNIKGLG